MKKVVNKKQKGASMFNRAKNLLKPSTGSNKKYTKSYGKNYKYNSKPFWQSRAAMFVGVFAVVGGGALLATNYAASYRPTGAKDIVVEKKVSRGTYIIKDENGRTTEKRPAFDFRLYGDGKLICAQNDGTMKQSQLSSDQVDQVYNKLQGAGLDHSQNLASKSVSHVKGTSVILNNGYGGANRLSYDESSSQSAAVTNVNTTLGETCAYTSDTTNAANPVAPLATNTPQSTKPPKRSIIDRVLNRHDLSGVPTTAVTLPTYTYTSNTTTGAPIPTEINPPKQSLIDRLLRREVRQEARQQVIVPQYVTPYTPPQPVTPQQVPQPKNYRIHRDRNALLPNSSNFATALDTLKQVVQPKAYADTVNWNDETDQFNRINLERHNRGIPLQGRSDCMTKAARDWAIKEAQFMQSTGYQQRPSDPGPDFVFPYCGSPNGFAYRANIGWSSPHACDVDDSQDSCGPRMFDDGCRQNGTYCEDGNSFMTSGEHRDNLLSTDTSLVATGAYRNPDGQLVVVHIFIGGPCRNNGSCNGGGWTAAPSPDSRSHEGGTPTGSGGQTPPAQQPPAQQPPAQQPPAQQPPAQQPAPSTPSSTGGLPVYRFYAPAAGQFFWTIDNSEANAVRASGSWSEQDPNGVPAFYAYTSQQSGTVPVYRLCAYNCSTHLWVTDPNFEGLRPDQSGSVWHNEGIAFYALTSGATPVHRLYNSGRFLYTTSGVEASQAASAGWQDSGIPAWYSAQ